MVTMLLRRPDLLIVWHGTGDPPERLALRRKLVRLITAFLLALIVPGSLRAAPNDVQVGEIVADVMTKRLQSDVAGAAVGVRVNSRTLLFNFGWANHASRHGITSDSLFNLGSVGKVFDATLLSLLAHRGEVSLDDSVAKYIHELQEG